MRLMAKKRKRATAKKKKAVRARPKVGGRRKATKKKRKYKYARRYHKHLIWLIKKHGSVKRARAAFRAWQKRNARVARRAVAESTGGRTPWRDAAQTPRWFPGKGSSSGSSARSSSSPPPPPPRPSQGSTKYADLPAAVRSKVEKLLRLSKNNPNAHEASLARERANEILARYGMRAA
jgi:hypothetical protein